MVMRALGAVLLVVLSVSACGDDPAASATACGVTADGADSGSEANEYVGLTSAELEAAADRSGLVIRVFGEDGDCAGDFSGDYRGDRVNVYLEDDRVTAARVF